MNTGLNLPPLFFEAFRAALLGLSRLVCIGSGAIKIARPGGSWAVPFQLGRRSVGWLNGHTQISRKKAAKKEGQELLPAVGGVGYEARIELTIPAHLVLSRTS